MRLVSNMLIIGLMVLFSKVSFAQSVIFSEPKNTPQQQLLHRLIKESNITVDKSILPDYIDNSKLQYFPAVFSQGGDNACSQASGVRYVYSYEVNRLLNRDAKASSENTFSYHFTWNFLNEGNNSGSHAYLGYDLMKQCGTLPLADMNDLSDAVSQTTWVSGYDKYIKAMRYGVEKYEKINLKTRDGIDKMRQYLFNGGVTNSIGRIASFSCYSSNWGDKYYNGPNSAGIKYIVTKTSKDGPHALTMVGYDDKVEFDFNNNGVIDDNERGAFIFVNSWGSYWGDNGKAYFPYSLFLNSVEDGGVREVDAEAYIVTPKIEDPKLYFKIKMTYNRRNELFVRMGANDGSDKTSPASNTISLSNIINLQGGAYPMQGEGSLDKLKTIEIALNYSEYADIIEKFTNPKFFLIFRRTGATGEGVINSFSVVDAVNGKEYVGSRENVPLVGGEIVCFTGEDIKHDGISRSKVEWLIPNTKTPYSSPFILKTANKKSVVMRVSGYDYQKGKMTIKYRKL